MSSEHKNLRDDATEPSEAWELSDDCSAASSVLVSYVLLCDGVSSNVPSSVIDIAERGLLLLADERLLTGF